jgi:hypothetical protein
MNRSAYRTTPYDEAILLCLGHLGGATAALIQGICMPGKATRTVQEVLSKMEGGTLLQQHHRSVRVGTATRRLPSVWELSPQGRGAIRRHTLAPHQLASMDRRTLHDAALLSEVLLAIYRGTPQLAGLYVAHEPAINPEREIGRAEAMVVIHRWSGEEGEPVGAIPWMPTIVRDTIYHRTTLMIELDDGVPPEGLRRRASWYPSPDVWRRTTRGMAPLPVWVVQNPTRQQQIQRAIGRAFEHRWLSVTWNGLTTNQWRSHQANRVVVNGTLEHCMADLTS